MFSIYHGKIDYYYLSAFMLDWLDGIDLTNWLPNENNEIYETNNKGIRILETSFLLYYYYNITYHLSKQTQM